MRFVKYVMHLQPEHASNVERKRRSPRTGAGVGCPAQMERVGAAFGGRLAGFKREQGVSG